MRIFSDEERAHVIETCSRRGEDGLKTWDDIREQLNHDLGRGNATPKTYQHIWKAYLDQTYGHEAAIEIQKEKFQLQDVKRETRNAVRDYARFETLAEHIQNAVNDLEPIDFHSDVTPKGDASAVVAVSDWHLGAKYDNFLGEYDSDIAKFRINEYANDVVDYIKKFDISSVLIINLNDLIEGNIHVSTRIQAELDAVEQTVLAAELLANFITHIYKNTGVKIRYGSVLDNHSRINKNKKDHIEKESFARIIDEFIRLRLPDLHMVGNPVDNNIGFTQFEGKRIAWVHGHLDTVPRVKNSVESLLGISVDYVYIAHRHNIILGENVFQVGSLKGSDEYAIDHRLFGKPTQTMTVFDGLNVNHFNIGFGR